MRHDKIITLKINTLDISALTIIINEFIKENQDISWENTLIDMQVVLSTADNCRQYQENDLNKDLLALLNLDFFLNVIHLKMSYNIKDYDTDHNWVGKVFDCFIFGIMKYTKLKYLELVIPDTSYLYGILYNFNFKNLATMQSLKILNLNNCFDKFNSDGANNILLEVLSSFFNEINNFSEIIEIKLPLSLNKIIDSVNQSHNSIELAKSIKKAALASTKPMRITPLPDNVKADCENIFFQKLKKVEILKLYDTYGENLKSIDQLQFLENQLQSTKQNLDKRSHELLQNIIQENNEILSIINESLSNYQNLSLEDLHHLIRFIIMYKLDPIYILPCLRALQSNDIHKEFIYKSLVEVISDLMSFESFIEQDPNAANLTDFVSLNGIAINYSEISSITSEKAFQLNMVKTLLKLNQEFALCNHPDTAELFVKFITGFMYAANGLHGNATLNELFNGLFTVDGYNNLNTNLMLTFHLLECYVYQDQIFSPEEQARADIYSEQDAEKQSMIISFYKFKDLLQQQALQVSEEASIRKDIVIAQLEERQSIILDKNKLCKC